MKNKILAAITAAVLAVGFTACGGSTSAATAENSTAAETTDVQETVDAVEETENTEDATEETQPAAEAAAETKEETAAAPAESETTAEGKDVLVVYFSATGTTKDIAEKIAAITDADLYEIKAAQEYTEADLDWNDSNSRTTLEQNDKSVRPEIASDPVSLEGYTTIYIGFPIWWGEEPRIMDTFVESYSFDGITMIPFCTSSSSGIGRSGQNLAENAGSGNWLDGQRFGAVAVLDEGSSIFTDSLLRIGGGRFRRVRDRTALFVDIIGRLNGDRSLSKYSRDLIVDLKDDSLRRFQPLMGSLQVKRQPDIPLFIHGRD